MNSTICGVLAIALFLVVELGASQAQDAQRTGAGISKEQVLARWADALGGREALQSVASIHLRGSIETSGLKGTYERWTTSRGEFRTAVDLSGAFRQVNVFDGHTGWRQDTSGTVHEISGDVLRGVVGATHEASYSFLFPGRMPGAVELEGENSAQDAYVVHLEPENGNPVTVYLDTKQEHANRGVHRRTAREIGLSASMTATGCVSPKLYQRLKSTVEELLPASLFRDRQVDIDPTAPRPNEVRRREIRYIAMPFVRRDHAPDRRQSRSK